LLGLNTTP